MQRCFPQLLSIFTVLTFFTFPFLTAEARTQYEYERLRTYEGAPPTIPHEVNKNLEQTNCMACHSQGGYSERFQAVAPRTPHPEFTMCLQCHVPKRKAQLFRGNSFPHWQNRSHPPQKTLSSAPPMIPHPKQYRQNCMTCHYGPAAVKQVQHPERKMCVQCHVWAKPKGKLQVNEE